MLSDSVVGLGASSLQDVLNLKQKTNVSGIAAGDLFVFQGKHKAVLITIPIKKNLRVCSSEDSDYKICPSCVMDTSTEYEFDSRGVCNHCKQFATADKAKLVPKR